MGRRSFHPATPISMGFVQIGNCGSPVELDDCWLLLTHGVGPVRKYSIGAVLLDKKILQRFWRDRASLLCVPSPPSAKAMCPTLFTHAAPCATATRSSCPTRYPITFSNFSTISIPRLCRRLRLTPVPHRAAATPPAAAVERADRRTSEVIEVQSRRRFAPQCVPQFAFSLYAFGDFGHIHSNDALASFGDVHMTSATQWESRDRHRNQGDRFQQIRTT